ncbi:Rrf2 family transcriptional regulator [Spirochaetia bacterium]|nr:Rrf2 family transcriptional regulator [Spirochaetia bacterium]
MKLSSRGRYGLRLLIDLMEHPNESSLTAVSEREGISLRYLEQLAMILKRSGFIRAVRGAAGGYILAKPADEIILADVLSMLEGDILVADPAMSGERETKIQRCIRLMVLDKLNTKIVQVLENKTLASLAGNHETAMYYI